MKREKKQKYFEIDKSMWTNNLWDGLCVVREKDYHRTLQNSLITCLRKQVRRMRENLFSLPCYFLGKGEMFSQSND